MRRYVSDGVVLEAYTGQRLVDCCAMGRTHCVAPDVRIIQQKTEALVDVREVRSPSILIERRRAENEPRRDELLLSNDGSSYSERRFSEHLRIWLDDQGWGDLSFHGLRYAAAGALNEAGATVATVVAVLGHRTYQMAIKYLMGREEQERAAGLMSGVAFQRGSGRA